jgi:hypothetical protein
MWEESLETMSNSLNELNLFLKTYRTRYDLYLSIVKAFPVFLASLITASISIFVYLVIYKLEIFFIFVPTAALIVVGCLTLFCSSRVRNYTFLINDLEKRIKTIQREITQRTERAKKQFIYLNSSGSEPRADYGNVHFFEGQLGSVKMRDMNLLEGGPRTRQDMEYIDHETVKEIDQTSDLFTKFNIKCYSVFQISKPIIEDKAARSIMYHTMITKVDPPLTMEEKVRIVVKAIVYKSNPTKYVADISQRELDLFAALNDPDDSFSEILKVANLSNDIIDLEQMRREVAERIFKINEKIHFQFKKLPEY